MRARTRAGPEPRVILKILDTRKKIVAPEALAGARRPLTLVYAFFDPFYAAHARRLEEVRAAAGAAATLAVCIDDNPATPALLPRSARAEMAAALRTVDYVLTEPATAVTADHVIDLRPEDAEYAASLRQRVHARNAAGKQPE